MIKEFKDFIAGGSVIDLAVGMVMGSAFTAIVNALVDGIINPIIGGLTSDIALDNLSISLGRVEIMYGSLISAFIKFIIIALFMFILVKAVSKLKREEETEEKAKEKTCPYCKTKILIDASRCPNCTSELEKEEQA